MINTSQRSNNNGELDSIDKLCTENKTKGYFNPIASDMRPNLGATYVCGPTHNVQHQHIPGYTGHVSGMYSENLHGKPYAKQTADSLNDRVEPGFIIEERQRFNLNYKEDYCNPIAKKTLYQQFGEDKKTKQIYQTDPNLPVYGPPGDPTHVHPIDRVPIVGYQGFVPTYMHPLKKQKKMEEMRKAYQSGEIQIPAKTEIDSEDMNVPIVGYTGFLPGKKARNVYGESYQQTAIDNEANKYLKTNM